MQFFISTADSTSKHNKHIIKNIVTGFLCLNAMGRVDVKFLTIENGSTSVGVASL